MLGAGTLQGHGVWHGTLYLRGGGDPTFGSVSFDSSAYGTGATVQRLVANLISSTGIKRIEGGSSATSPTSTRSAARRRPASGPISSTSRGC